MTKHPQGPAAGRDEVVEKLQKAAVTKTRPDGSDYLSLSFAQETELSTTFGLSRRELQITALKHGITPERYCRNQKGLSSSDQVRFLQTHVAVIGLGGLGGAVTEILARLGIGRMTLVDGDCFDESNLNRQLLSTVEQLGKMKAEAAAERVRAVNPAVEVTAVAEFLTAENRQKILAGADIAADCLDTITSRFVLETGCREEGIPLVSAAIGGTSVQLTVVRPKTGEPGLERIYDSPDSAPKKGVEASLGTQPYTAIAAAAFQCTEIAALASGKSANLINRLLLADCQIHSMDIVQLA